MNQGTEWGLLMKKNRSQKSRASVPLKSNEVTFFRKECNELLVIRYFILGVTVPLQLLVTAI
jgi:hypothetical protein